MLANEDLIFKDSFDFTPTILGPQCRCEIEGIFEY